MLQILHLHNLKGAFGVHPRADRNGSYFLHSYYHEAFAIKLCYLHKISVITSVKLNNHALMAARQVKDLIGLFCIVSNSGMVLVNLII